MKCTTLLELQHRNISQLCEAIEGGSPSVRESLLPQLANDLAAHLRVEEELFYPAAHRVTGRAGPDSRTWKDVAHAKMAHLLLLPPSDSEFERRAAELRALLAVHIDADRVLAAEVEEALSPAESRALAARMMLLHGESVEAGYERTSLALLAEAPPVPHARV